MNTPPVVRMVRLPNGMTEVKVIFVHSDVHTFKTLTSPTLIGELFMAAGSTDIRYTGKAGRVAVWDSEAAHWYNASEKA